MKENETVLRRASSAIRREPILSFLILGVAFYGLWSVPGPRELQTIRIDSETLRNLESRKQELLGRPLTDAERDAVREGFIDDEILLREALDRGLQWSDPGIRQRLAGVMRATLTETVPDPSEEQLRAHFGENIDRFSSPESATLQQVTFARGEQLTRIDADGILEKLRAGADHETFGSGSVTARLPRPALQRAFGADVADQVLALTPGEWHGPLESVRGIHFVRVIEHHALQVPVFEEVKNYVRQDWGETRTRELQKRGLDEIRENYRIEVVEE